MSSDINNPMERPRYVGVPSFFRAPLREDLNDVDIGIIGVPFDGGVTSRSGARHGPREVRNQSTLVRMKNPSTGIAPHELCKVADIGDVWVESPFELQGSHKSIEQSFTRIVQRGITPLTVGGDHSISLPILRALATVNDGPPGMIHIDAHCDTGDDYMGSRFHHGAPFRRAVEMGVLDPQRTVQIGIRGSVNDLDLWKFSRDSGMRVVSMEEFYSLGINAVIEIIKETVGSKPAYFSFDIDSLDPAYAPGTGTPEIGGLTTLEAQLLIRGCQGIPLIGADLVEVAPAFDSADITSLAAANLLFELLCLLSTSRVTG